MCRPASAIAAHDRPETGRKIQIARGLGLEFVLMRFAWTGIGLTALAAGCSEPTAVSTSELAEIVERDGVPFVRHTIPAEILERLSAHRVVIVGETHLIWEHRELMVALVESLHARGFQQLLLEWPHMADWLLADYVTDQPEVGWEPPDWFFRDVLIAIREFNRGLPAAARIRVRAIDVNLDEYGGAADFRGSITRLSRHLEGPGPVDEFLGSPYGTPEAQARALHALRDELDEHVGP